MLNCTIAPSSLWISVHGRFNKWVSETDRISFLQKQQSPISAVPKFRLKTGGHHFSWPDKSGAEPCSQLLWSVLFEVWQADLWSWSFPSVYHYCTELIMFAYLEPVILERVLPFFSEPSHNQEVSSHRTDAGWICFVHRILLSMGTFLRCWKHITAVRLTLMTIPCAELLKSEFLNQWTHWCTVSTLLVGCWIPWEEARLL